MAMEPDTSVMMVWSMAAMEAQALGWSEIEPSHLLGAALKFAELDADDLERLAEGAQHVGELRQHHQDLRTRLNEPWGIAVPDVSTPLRRSLRRRGDGKANSGAGGMIHRSDAARDVFRTGQAVADRDGGRGLLVADLVDVILRDPDQWVRRGLDQQSVISASQLAQHDHTIEEWGGLFFPLKPPGSHAGADTRRILADPTVKVLADKLAKPGPLPCLLIHGPDRTAHEVLTDLLHRRRDTRPPKITRIDSRSLLERLSEDTSFSAATFLEFLIDESNSRTVWFIDSLHRYLSDELTSPMFRTRFTRWLKLTDSRFIFAIPESQFNKRGEQHSDWKDIFQLIWVYAPDNSAFTEL